MYSLGWRLNLRRVKKQPQCTPIIIDSATAVLVVFALT